MLREDAPFLQAWLNWGSAGEQLSPLLVGDSLQVLLAVVTPAIRNDPGRTITTAWLTVKAKEDGAEPTANAAWTETGGQLKITATNNGGIGQIEQTSAGSGQLRFDLTSANTVVLQTRQTYYFDVQVKLSDNSLYTVERGTFDTLRGITTVTS